MSSLAWSGTVKGAVRKAYDGKFRLASESVDGFDGSNAFTYDADGLLKSASGVSITREALTGRVAGTSYRSIVASRSYDATYGELSEYKATAFGTTLYGATYLFVHEIVIHGRVPLKIPARGYAGWLRDSHRIHHLFGGEPYGMLMPFVPRSLRERAGGAARSPLDRSTRTTRIRL